MERFLADYEVGKQQGRYIDAELPTLPFEDRAFDLALGSHFLFLYSEQFSEDFHVAAIREMARVATEVRVFPLLALGAKRSPHVDAVQHRLQADGYFVGIEKVPYEFQRGGDQMMKVGARPR
jgi:ubiquinone/menaquinone biosynthesis C-methylase UbiE